MDPGESTSRKFFQSKVVELARRMIAGEVGIIAGSREMSGLGARLVDTRFDQDFKVFLSLDSETGDLPLESERDLWDPAAYAELSQKARKIEAEEQTRVYVACRSIIDRFAQATS